MGIVISIIIMTTWGAHMFFCLKYVPVAFTDPVFICTSCYRHIYIPDFLLQLMMRCTEV
ncbi:MAG: hypothetical protein R3A12_11535 [Ignavibacteria bacterium]